MAQKQKLPENLLFFTKTLPRSRTIGRVVEWLYKTGQKKPSRIPALSSHWHLMEDSDGAIIFLPVLREEPGFTISVENREYHVLICDPEAMDELGPFDTLEDALSGIEYWLSLPVAVWDSEAGLPKEMLVF